MTGLTMGALVGAGLVFLGTAVVLGPLAIYVGAVSLFFWAFGLFVIATPGWWLLHRLGARCQTAAMIYGGGLTLAVEAVYLAADYGVLRGGPMLLAGLSGAAVGWVVARVAYAPAPT
ncbi:MAG: hypothetical protein Q8L66_08155 [Caulobacter sp.]|nr:hypothetical protein [Caulobacter sp.]